MNEIILFKARASISGFIQNKRKELGISQAALAEQSGMGVATIKRFESGLFWINLKQLIILCKCLKIDEIKF